MSQTPTRISSLHGESVGTADYPAPPLVEPISSNRTPTDILICNKTFSTTATPNVANAQSLHDMYVTCITIVPFTPANTLTIWIQFGGYHFGTQATPLVITGVVYNRFFLEPHLPLLHAGDSVTISGSDSSGQSVTVVLEGYKVQPYE